MINTQLQKSKEESPSKVILIGEGAKILINERGEIIMFFRIIVKNGAGFEVYNKIIQAKDENEAIKQTINDVDIACGDTIDIDYI